ELLCLSPVVVHARTLRRSAAPRLSSEPDVADGQPDLLAEARGSKLREQHRSCARPRAFVLRVLRLGEACRAPTVGRVQVQLVLEDDEAGALEELDPLERRPLQMPPVILAAAGGNAHEQPSVAREHAPKLAQRRFVAVVVRACVEAVHRVVAPDVLERRDAKREVEVAVLERQVAYVCDDVCRLGEVGGDQLRGGEAPEPFEVRGNRVRRPDVEDAMLAGIPGEAPWDLDRALVAPRRSAQLARAAAPSSLEARAGEPVVEELDQLELATLDELAHEPRQRDLAAREAPSRLRIGGAPEHEAPELLDEVVHAREARVTSMPLHGKRVFITGGAGFIATTLGRLLVEDNEVIAYDHLHRDALSATELREHPNFHFVHGDVLDAEHVAAAAKGATHIVHCAAIAGVDTVRESPVRTMRVNMIGTYNVLEAALATQGSLERIVDFSTSEVFGTHADNVHEGHVSTIGSVGEARWTYAVSKLAGEHLAHAYHDELNL